MSPGLIFAGELICGGAYYWRGFCVLKWVGLDNKNSPWAYIREGLLSEGYLRLRFRGLIIIVFFLGGGGYYRNFTVLHCDSFGRKGSPI